MPTSTLRRPAAGLAIAASLVLAALAPVAAQQVPTSGGNNRPGVANASAQDGSDIVFNTNDGTASTSGGSGTAALPPRIPSSNVASARIPVVTNANGPDGIPVGATTSTSTPATVNGQPVESGTYIPDQTPPPAPVDTSGDYAPADGSGDYAAADNSGDYAPVDNATDGSGATADGGDAAPADAAPADASADAPQPQYTCADFIGWYDAQSTYDARGGTGQDWVTVDAVDPDWNGVACEDLPGGPAAAS